MAKRKRAKHWNGKSKTSLEKNLIVKSVLIPLVCLLLATIGYLVWGTKQDMGTLEGLNYIKSFVGSGGKLNDFQGKLGMDDPKEDIKWFYDEEGIRIEFGKIIMDFTEAEFLSDNIKGKLKDIGITYDVKEKGDQYEFKLYYLGTEIERYIR